MPHPNRLPRPLRRARALLLPAALLLAAVLLPALPDALRAAPERHKLILDWFPNADHVPLYVARDGGFFAKEGLEIELIAPADPNDPLKLVAAGQAPFAINYQPNVTIARAQGLPVRAIGVLVEHPLSSLAFLKKSGIRGPADLKGKRIGYSVQELELALLRALAASAGLKPGDYETVNVNFNLTSALLSGQVDAVMGAFWNYELAELELEGVPGGYLAMRDHGIPDYYELVVITNDRFLERQRGTAQRLVRALQAALDFTRAEPEQALALYLKANPEVRKELDERAFRLVRGEFARSQTQSAEKWERFARFAREQGVIERVPATGDLFTNLLP
jgi:putative hydroxymethylpyrimidine transport system substrate-binding protein